LVTRINATNGGGVILNPGVSNDLPNLTSGSVWVGNNDSVPVTVTTSSLIPAGTVSSSIQVSYTGLSDIPSGILSSSTQINNLSDVSASFATSASRAQTASLALAVDYINVSNKPTLVSASSQIDVQNTTGITTIATTGSNTFTGIQTISNTTNATDWNSGALIVDGGVGIEKDVWISGSLNIIGLLTAVSTSIQYVTASQVDIGNNIINLNTDTPTLRYGGISVVDSGSVGVSASLLYDSLTNNWVFKHKDTGEPTEDFSNVLFGPLGTGPDDIPVLTGNYIVKVENDGHGHHLTTSSIVDNGTTVIVETQLSVVGAVSASAFSGSGAQITGVTAANVDYANVNNKPTLISASSQVSYTGLSDIPTGILSSSTQINNLSGVSASFATSASRAQTASLALAVDYTNVNNKPTLVSASSQVSYTGLSDIPVGIVSSSTQVTTLLPAGTISSSGQVSYTGLSNIPAGIVSASSQVSYTGLSNIPSGILSSSTQINNLSGVSASFAQTASFLLGSVTSASFATSASRAQTASLALAVDYANVNNKPTLISASSQVSYTGLANVPAGILSSSTQINNLSGVSASFATSASRAVTSSFAISASWAPGGTAGATFPFSGSAVITGSLLVSGSGITITGSLSTDRYNLSITSLGNASGSMSIDLSTANYFTATSTNTTNWSIINTPSNRAVGFILAIVSGGAVANTWPVSVQWPNGSPPVLTPSGGLDVLTFITDNSGTNWRGVLSIINSK
jgi:hypothetical protein